MAVDGLAYGVFVALFFSDPCPHLKHREGEGMKCPRNGTLGTLQKHRRWCPTNMDLDSPLPLTE